MSFDQRPAQAKVRISPTAAMLVTAPAPAEPRPEPAAARAPSWLFVVAALIGGAASSAALTWSGIDVARLVSVPPAQPPAIQGTVEAPFDPR